MDLLPYLLFPFRWQDVLDIALNSYILFRLYVVFRGTAVFRIIVGIAALWVFQRVSAAVGLIVTSWLMQGFTAFAALIILIIFKEEIRRVLSARDFKSLLWGLPQHMDHPPVETLVEGVYELARMHCGALLVLPGKLSLDEMLRSGIDWNGKISREMLLSVFWPGNPVHDGAAIVQGDRITSVATILPLSQREDFPSYFGTRHRAAAGLTESADALVIVVSEERGEVSVARDGQVRRVKGPEDLVRIVSAHFGLEAEGGRRRLRQRLAVPVAAVVSVLLVTGIWLGFSRGQEALVVFTIPVAFENRDPALVIHDTSATTVQVKLAGAAPIIRALKADHVKVSLNLDASDPGVNTYALSVENVRLPPGVRLQTISPSLLEVDLDVTMTRKVPLQVDWSGRLKAGLTISTVELVPDQVVVVGASRMVGQVATLYTEKLSLDDISESGAARLALVLTPAGLELAAGSRGTVDVRYTVSDRKK